MARMGSPNQQHQGPRDVSTLTEFIPEFDKLACGQYIVSGGPIDSVEANKGVIEKGVWFETGPLSDGLIDRINSIQLITESHDQGESVDTSSDNWTWFEVSVVHATWDKQKNQNISEVESGWMSHENAFATSTHTWREGRIFSRDHNFLKFLRKTHEILIFDTRNPHGHFLKTHRKLEESDLELLKHDLEAAYFAGLAASLAKESAKSLEHLCETQIKEAATIAIRWSRRYAAAKQGKGDLRLATWNGMKLELTDDPVLVPVRLPGTVERGGSLVFSALPYRPVEDAAWDIVKKGREAVLSFVPTARFGKIFVTADRNEVHKFRNIAHAVEQYLLRDDEKPLSIAVFGKPGSGKSFGVKEVIKSIMKEAGQADDMEIREFNLSQFQEVSDLERSFETIRDTAMENKLPVVLFDEFDTTLGRTPLFWLEHLWSPMKDGKWKLEQGGERRLGRAIYVFIGGTAQTLEEFREASSTITKVHTSIKSPPIVPLAPGEPDETAWVPEDCKELTAFLDHQLGGSRENLKPLSFRISPEKKYQNLVDFFYKIRERTISKQLPIVFFECFDANLGSSDDTDAEPPECLGWLKYFLAPMQDGVFIDGGHSRPLGRAIFVFVGGESGLIQKFLDRQNGGKEDVKGAADFFRAAKGTDFMSRLRGYATVRDVPTEDLVPIRDMADVVQRYCKEGKEAKPKPKPLSLGCFRNRLSELPADVYRPRSLSDGQGPWPSKRKDFANFIGNRAVDVQGPNENMPGQDKMFSVRRAILLRSMLDRLSEATKINLDDHVLNALLGVERFHHGARSLESILSMSKLTEEGEVFTRGSLPEESQIRLHVGWKRFEELLKEAPKARKNGVNDPTLRLRRAEIANQKARLEGEVTPDADYESSG